MPSNLPPFQVLARDGTITDNNALLSLELGGDTVLAIYEDMVTARLLYDFGKNEGHSERMTLFIGPLWQEAVISTVYALGKKVWIYPYGRQWHIALARDVSVKSILDGFYVNPSAEAIKDFHKHRVRPPYVVVGAQLLPAVGAAWAAKILGQKIIPTAAYFGDGATAQGDFHGAMSHAKIHHVPTIFFCENNQYAISTHVSLNSPTQTLADRARGYDIVALRADGNDLFACFAVAKWAYEYTLTTSEPVFVELVTYRGAEHTTAVGEIIKIPIAERAEAEKNEPLIRTRSFLASKEAQEVFGVNWDDSGNESLENKLRDVIKKAGEQSYREFLEAKKRGRELVKKTVSWLATPQMDHHFQNLAQSGVAMKRLKAADADKGFAVRDVIGIAAFDAMLADTRVVWLGQDVNRSGGVNRTSAVPQRFAREESAVKKLLPDFEKHILRMYLPLGSVFPGRVIDMPLNEAAIAGTGFGLSLGDGEKCRARPIMEVQFSGFVRLMLHQIEEHSRHHYRTQTLDIAPGVYFLPSGVGERIEFHRDVELSLFTNNPALIIVFPSSPQDYYDMFFAAIASNKPVIFFSHLDLYRQPRAQELLRRPPRRPIEEFGPRNVEQGKDITVVTYGRGVYECQKAVELVRKKRHGFSADLFDLRLIKPLVMEEIVDSVKRTGHFLSVQEEPMGFGTGAELVRRVTKEAFLHLEAPPESLGPPDTFPPPSKFWDDYLPQPPEITEKIIEILNF